MDTVSIHCASCNHKNVCKLKDSYTELISQVNNMYMGSCFSISVKCSEFSGYNPEFRKEMCNRD